MVSRTTATGSRLQADEFCAIEDDGAPELAHPQVAEAAVHELRGRARGSGCEVVSLDQSNFEPVACRQLRDAGAHDPTADDEQVEPLRQ
jgi:hypothetical protein